MIAAISPRITVQRRPLHLAPTLASAVLLACLTACGGGGSDDPKTDTGPEVPPPVVPVGPVATQLTGVAATGAALSQANVLVLDRSGATVCDTQTDAQGVYQCTLAAGVARPLVIRASKDDTVLYSTTAETGNARANVTPLTHIIVSKLTPDGNPASLTGLLQTTPSAVTAATLKTQTDALLAALQPLLTALNLGTVDPLAGTLVADGTGQDKLLDSITVSVRPDGAAANIEVTVKTIPNAGNSAPVSIQFRSNDVMILPLPNSLTVASLAPVPTPAVVADLFARLNACFALPLSQRVTAVNDSTAVVGGPADVIAPACRSLFVDNDPATFLSNGARIGRSASNTGAFAGLFRPGATGLAWYPGKVEFFRSNGDMVVSGGWRDSQGNTANETHVVRNVANSLKLVGNQNRYGATVRAWGEDRDFFNTPQFSYYSTGYNVRVDNLTDSTGAPVFSKVLVTTPKGETLTLQPTAGQRLLAIAISGSTAGGTSVLRLAAGYRDTALVADAPAIKEPTLAFASPTLSDAEIGALQDQGVWTFEFFHADTSVPNVTQQSRTISRPYTIGELRLKPMAQFTAATRAELVAESAAGFARFTEPDTAQIGDASTPAWTVPIGALAPTSVGVYGRAPFGSTTPDVSGNRFDDTTGVSSTATWAQVACSSQSNADKHCAGQGLYAVNTTVNMVELWVLDSRQVEITKKAALYKLQ